MMGAQPNVSSPLLTIVDTFIDCQPSGVEVEGQRGVRFDLEQIAEIANASSA